jgi:hypothetical protein
VWDDARGHARRLPGAHFLRHPRFRSPLCIIVSYAAGHIGTSHWNGSALYILGKADVDTDEFDDHVIVHEWGHYFESTLPSIEASAGSGVAVTFFADNPNALSQNRYLRFTGNGASHTVEIATATSDDVDVAVYQKGALQAVADSLSGSETTTPFTAASGVEYIIMVTGFGGSASYTTTVTLH